MPRPKKVRKLVSLYAKKERDTIFIDFAYYINGEWTGESEEGYITYDQFYKAVRRYLKKEKAEVRRRF
jgi:serine protease inhibitor